MDPENSGSVGSAAVPPFPIDKLVALLVDHEAGEIIHVSEDCLRNRVIRDAGQYAESFDALCVVDLQRLSRLFSLGSAIHLIGTKYAIRENDPFLCQTGLLLANAYQGVAAATALLRNGFRMQPGIIIRTVIESVCAVLHVCQVPSDLQRLVKGDLPSQKTVPSAKKMLPPLGKYYGLFSQEFTHLGTLHWEVPSVGPYTAGELPLRLNLNLLGLAVWLLYVATELLYLDAVEPGLAWGREGDRVRYQPCAELETFLTLLAESATTGSEQQK